LRNPSPAGAKKAFRKSDHISLPQGFADQQHNPADQIGSDFLQSNTDAKTDRSSGNGDGRHMDPGCS
jgi:hypothetical protein